MPESSLPTAGSGSCPGPRIDDSSAGGPEDGGTASGANAPSRTEPAEDGGSHVIAGLDLARLAVSLLSRAVLFAVLGLLVWAVLPIAMGWQTTTVVTNSMVPRIYAGDIIVARPIPTGTAALGQILLVDDPDHADRLRLHRYVEAAPDGGLILRGDANPANDSSPVTPEAVHGVAVLRVPFAGLPVVWFTEKNWGNLAAVFIGMSTLVLAAASGSGTSTPRLPATARPARRTRTVQALLALAAVAVPASTVLSTTAHAGFSAAAPTGASSFSALASYPCPAPTLPPDSPTFFYRFNENSGRTAENASGTQHNGTLSRESLRERGSCRAHPSPALKLGGSPAGYVSAGAAPVAAPDAFSVEIWFRTADGSTDGGRLIGFGNSQTGNSSISDRHLYITPKGAIAFGVATRNGNSNQFKASGITSSATYNDGKWHLATVTSSPSGTVAYIDGVQVAANKGLVAERPYDGFWRIGYDSMDFDKTGAWPDAPASASFAGTVDNAAVYPAALTAGQVAAHFNSAKGEIRGS